MGQEPEICNLLEPDPGITYTQERAIVKPLVDLANSVARKLPLPHRLENMFGNTMS